MADQMRNTSGANQPITRHPLFPAIASLWGAAAFGLGSLAIPGGVIDRIIGATHLSAIIPHAAPPLGARAHIMIALGMTIVGGIVALLLVRRFRSARPETTSTRRTRTLATPPREDEAVIEVAHDMNEPAPFSAPFAQTSDFAQQPGDVQPRRRTFSMSETEAQAEPQALEDTAIPDDVAADVHDGIDNHAYDERAIFASADAPDTFADWDAPAEQSEPDASTSPSPLDHNGFENPFDAPLVDAADDSEIDVSIGLENTGGMENTAFKDSASAAPFSLVSDDFGEDVLHAPAKFGQPAFETGKADEQPEPEGVTPHQTSESQEESPSSEAFHSANSLFDGFAGSLSDNSPERYTDAAIVAPGADTGADIVGDTPISLLPGAGDDADRFFVPPFTLPSDELASDELASDDIDSDPTGQDADVPHAHSPAPAHDSNPDAQLDPKPFPSSLRNPSALIASRPLDSLSPMELLERLALAMEAQRKANASKQEEHDRQAREFRAQSPQADISTPDEESNAPLPGASEQEQTLSAPVVPFTPPFAAPPASANDQPFDAGSPQPEAYASDIASAEPTPFSPPAFDGAAPAGTDQDPIRPFGQATVHPFPHDNSAGRADQDLTGGSWATQTSIEDTPHAFADDAPAPPPPPVDMLRAVSRPPEHGSPFMTHDDQGEDETDIPDAMRPVDLDPIAWDEPEADDALGDLGFPQAFAATPLAAIDQAVDGHEDESSDNTPEIGQTAHAFDEPELEQGYSSLLDLSRPGRARREFVRIEDSDTEAEPLPAVVFPGDEAAPATTQQVQQPAPKVTRPFDAPAKPDANDPGETERALRAALATLQRMSGTR